MVQHAGDNSAIILSEIFIFDSDRIKEGSSQKSYIADTVTGKAVHWAYGTEQKNPEGTERI